MILKCVIKWVKRCKPCDGAETFAAGIMSKSKKEEANECVTT